MDVGILLGVEDDGGALSWSFTWSNLIFIFSESDC